MPASNNLNAIENLTETIKSLYEPGARDKHKLVSRQLESFRLEESAWHTSVQLLVENVPRSDAGEDDICFFTANTLASIACKGIKPPLLDAAISDIVQVIHRHGCQPTSPVMGQLCLSLGALLVWNSYYNHRNIFELALALLKAIEAEVINKQAAEDATNIAETTTDETPSMMKHTDNYLILLQLFRSILDVIVCDRKLALSKIKRLELTRTVLMSEDEMEALLSSVHDANVICDGVETVQSLCCQVVTAFVRALLWYGEGLPGKVDFTRQQTAIGKVAASSVLTLDLREWLLNASISKEAVELFTLLCSCANQPSSHTLLGSLLDILAYVANKIQNEMGLMTADTRNHVEDFLTCLEELSTELIHQVLYDTNNESMTARNLLSTALRTLHIPDIQIRMGAIKVFYALLLHHLACLKVFEKDDSMITIIIHREEVLKQFLAPLIDILFTQVIAFPPVPDYETFDFKSWFEMRDLCASVIADCSVVCQYETVLEMAGGELQRWVQFASQDPNAGVLFTRIEACLFSLTTIVSIAPAGKDEYIPLALRLLPQLQYPQDKYEGVLFRAVASRLLLWTAGYIGTHKQHCMSLLPLCAEFLNWICGLKNSSLCESSFASYVEHAERTTGEAIVAICSASSSFSARLSSSSPDLESNPMSSDTETVSVLETEELHSLLELLSPLAVLEGAALETRSAVLIAIGTLMGMMSIETASVLHSALIASLTERHRAACNSFGRESRKGRESLKLLFVGFECLQLYKDPGLPSINQLGRIEDTNHPLVASLRNHWNMIEESLIGDNASDTSIESCCHALFNIITECRWYFIGSPILDKLLKLLETSMRRTPNVFHLNTVRGLIRILGPYVSLTGTGPFLNLLDVVTHLTLHELCSDQREAEDLLGMGIDILNVTLKNPLLTYELLSGDILPEMIKQLTNRLPSCPHPKVRLTVILFFARLLEWLNPCIQEPKWIRARLSQFPELTGSIVGDWENKCDSAKKKLSSILIDMLSNILDSLFALLLTCFEDNSCWIRLLSEIHLIIRQDENASALLKEFYSHRFGEESDYVSSFPEIPVPKMTDLFPIDNLRKLRDSLSQGTLDEVQEAVWLIAVEAEAWQLAHGH